MTPAIVFLMVLVGAVIAISVRRRIAADNPYDDGEPIVPVPMPDPAPATPAPAPKRAAGANEAAAAILEDLLAGAIAPHAAQQAWPTDPVSVEAAESYIDYFIEGLDGRGMRDPMMDRMVRDMVRDLRAQPSPDPNAVPEVASEGDEDSGRPPVEILRRLYSCVIGAERANTEFALREGQIGLEEAQQQVGVVLDLTQKWGLGNALDAIEASALQAGLGDLDEPHTLTLHWRNEVIITLAWAVGISPDIPPVSEQGDAGPAMLALREAGLDIDTLAAAVSVRPAGEIGRMMARLAEERSAAMTARQSDPGNELLAMQNSRALERYRALRWLRGPYDTLMDTPTQPAG